MHRATIKDGEVVDDRKIVCTTNYVQKLIIFFIINFLIGFHNIIAVRKRFDKLKMEICIFYVASKRVRKVEMLLNG